MPQTNKKNQTSGKAKSVPRNNTKNTPSKKQNASQNTRQIPITAVRQRKGEPGFMHQAAPYIMAVFAILIAVCVIMGEGKVGGSIRGILTGLFSGAAYTLPIFILLRVALWKRDSEEGQSLGRSICTTVVFLLIAILFHVLGGGEATLSAGSHYTLGNDLVGGGVIGGVLGQLFIMGFGRVCTLIIVFAAVILLSLYIAGITPRGAFIYIAYKIKFAHEKSGERRAANLEKRNSERFSKNKIREEEYLEYLRNKKTENKETAPAHNLTTTAPEDMPDSIREVERDGASGKEPTVYHIKKQRMSKIDFPDDEDDGEWNEETNTFVNSGKAVVIGDSADKVGISAAQPTESIESDTVPFDGEAVDEKIFDEVMRRTRERIEKSRQASGEIVGLQNVSPDAAESKNNTVAKVGAGSENGDFDVSNIFANPADAELIDRLSEAYRNPLEVKREAVSTSLPSVQKPIRKSAPEYKFPPIEILAQDPGIGNADIKGELQENAVKLVETLKSFNVRTKIENISRGPTITRYELLPEPGTRVRSIVNLVDDIALNLATTGVRIEAPIPGKSAVGVEVPNKNQAMVHLRTLIEDSRFVDSKSKLTVCLGENVAGEAVYFDIAKMPHLLIAGCTGSGKSVCINSIITSILYKASPEDVKLILIDPKKVELNIYNGIPHLLVPVVTEPKKAAGALSWAVSEMERRFGLIEAVGVRDIKNYNNAVKNNPDYEYLPRIVIFIDELADLMMTAPDDVEASICRIAQKARAAGMHLIVGTQRPSVDVITGLIKANIPSRIAFRTSSQIDSRTIIDIGSAANLIGSGDMLFNPVGALKPIRVQGAFVSENDVEEVVKYVKNMNSSSISYSDEVVNLIERESQKCGAKKNGAALADEDGVPEEDPMLKSAIELAIESGKISTSLIQRRLSLGYGRAAKLIDRMEQLGYVSAPDGQKPREVIITKQAYMEMRLKDEAPFDT